MNFYNMTKRGDCLIKEYPEGSELIIPQEDVVAISLYILHGARNGARKRR